MLYCCRGPERGPNGPLAQLVEHRTFNPGVVGSIPTRPTIPRWRIPVAAMVLDAMVNVKIAAPSDRDAVVYLVGKLLSELGGTPPSAEAMSAVFDRLADDGETGFVALGETDNGVAAVCTVSFLQAMRAAGRYAIIQEMFVEPAERSTGVGLAVLRFALEQAATRGCTTVELGTPFNGERQIQFYERGGVTNIGARLRWRL